MGNHQKIGNFTAAKLGDFTQLNQYTFTHDLLPFGVEGKKFLKEDLALTGMEVSLMCWNISLRLPATVISSTGYWISPFSTQKPAAPRE